MATGNTTSKYASTGDPATDSALSAIQDEINTLQQSGGIPAGLQITPALTAEFLSMAHANVDPATQQYIENTVADINANTEEFQTAFSQQQAAIDQQFGSDLASEQNAAGMAGIASSGERRQAEALITASANRNLASLANTAQYQEGQNLRAGAAAVGSANVNQLLNPNLNFDSLTNAGGSGAQMGTVNAGAGGALNYNFNPSAYTIGSIPSQGALNVENAAGQYGSEYGTLAANPINANKSPQTLMSLIQPASQTPITSTSLQ